MLNKVICSNSHTVPFPLSELYLCTTPPYTVLLNVHFTGNTVDEKLSYEELLHFLCGAGKPVSSKDTGHVVSFLPFCADQVQDPVQPLLVAWRISRPACTWRLWIHFLLFVTERFSTEMPDIIKWTLICLLSRVTSRSIFWLRIYFMLNTIFYRITNLKT